MTKLPKINEIQIVLDKCYSMLEEIQKMIGERVMVEPMIKITLFEGNYFCDYFPSFLKVCGIEETIMLTHSTKQDKDLLVAAKTLEKEIQKELDLIKKDLVKTIPCGGK